MKGHPSRKEIIGAALDDSRTDTLLREHLERCPACGAIYADAAKLLTPSAPALMAPPDGALERIVAAHKARKTMAEKPAPQSWKEILLRPVSVSALAAVMAAAVIIPLFFFFKVKTEDDMTSAFDMTLTRVEGKASRTVPLSSSDPVMTPAGEQARILLDGRLDITLDGGSHLVLDTSLRDRTGRRRRIDFTLAHGSLRARLAQGAGIEAAFKTPHGRVTALCTEFRITVGDTTAVLLREGSLAVESAAGEKTVIPGGSKCTIAGGIATVPMDAADFAAFTEPSVAPKAADPVAVKKESPGTVAGPNDRVIPKGPNSGAQPDGSVQKRTSKSALREEIKNELRGAKEMRRSMRRGAK